ncbi:MAG: manganese efflux pump [Proteobacteria bacterium]|nr:manganese efflux pump [Pseudomonadota bacterium]
MSFLTILLIAVGLGMDAFAVAISAGVVLREISFGQIFRLSFHFGLFQFLMPIVGWFAGMTVSGLITGYDHWIAFCLLVCIGGKMIRDSFKKEDEIKMVDPTRGFTLIVLSIATSIDALAVGLSLAFLNVTILYPSVVIGVVASAMTVAGMLLGKKLGQFFDKKVEILGGLILIGIGIKYLIEHLSC